jgi:4-methyl-5(b-hydroxyethyl)-thiazole monophosphate biosynthesis
VNKKLIVPLAEGFEEIEVITIIDILRRAEIDVISVGLKSLRVRGSHNILVEADTNLEEVKNTDFDGIVLPGGMLGVSNLKNDMRIIRMVKTLFKERKLITAICAAPLVLYEAGVLNGKKFTVHPSLSDQIPLYPLSEQVVVDENVVTGQACGAALKFSFKIVEKLLGRDKVSEVNKSVLANL